MKQDNQQNKLPTTGQTKTEQTEEEETTEQEKLDTSICTEPQPQQDYKNCTAGPSSNNKN